MKFDYSRLRGRIREKFKTQSEFAAAIGISSTSLSKKLNNAVEFKPKEIIMACQQLTIQPEEIHCFFFLETKPN